MPVLNNALLMFIVVLTVFIGFFLLAVYLFKNNYWKTGFFLALCLVVSVPLVCKAIPTTSEPTEPMICSACQETLAETYSCCPYCGEPQGN